MVIMTFSKKNIEFFSQEFTVYREKVVIAGPNFHDLSITLIFQSFESYPFKWKLT